MEIFVKTCKEVFKDVDSVVGTQEVICGALNYYNVTVSVCVKVAEVMVYDMLDES